MFGVSVENSYLCQNGVCQSTPTFPFKTEEEAKERAKSAVLSWCEWHVVSDPCAVSQELQEDKTMSRVLKCCITEQEVTEADVFAMIDGLVVSQAGANTLPEDLRRPPFLNVIAQRRAKGWRWPQNPWTKTFVFVRTYIDSYACHTVDIMKNLVRGRAIQDTSIGVNGLYHVVVGGKYEFSVFSDRSDVFIKVYEWVFSHPTLRLAAARLTEQVYDSRHGVWVLTEGQECGLSNHGSTGLVETVEQAEDEIRKVARPGYRYHIVADGRYVKTIDAVRGEGLLPAVGTEFVLPKADIGQIELVQLVKWSRTRIFSITEDGVTIGKMFVYDNLIIIRDKHDRVALEISCSGTNIKTLAFIFAAQQKLFKMDGVDKLYEMMRVGPVRITSV